MTNSAPDSIQSPTKTNRIPSKNGVEKAKVAVGVGSGKPGPVTVRLPPATKTSENAAQPVEAALIIDGEIRTLRYQLFDWQGNPVPSPDFETLAKIMTLQLLPFKFPPERPGETVVLPTEEDEKAAEKRLEEKIAKDEKDSKRKAGDDWRSEGGPEVSAHPGDTTNEGVGVAIGLIVFAATVFYWAWEVSRDLE
ncbi:unnamed protein product [Heligmosomoides polygyrus]|uniref:UBX domain-containing protein n=1 Tax=Heligmosomoides polygyrus TaxID=6339 RepID=A0A183F6I0_HELPZ|nr:unnamed protein product [Heligmosomoides polygyrus]